MNILKKADEIINDRSEEKVREYGPIDDNIKNMVDLFKIMSGKELSIEEGYMILICNKLARQSFKHKEDNLLDLCAYTGALNNYVNKKF